MTRPSRPPAPCCPRCGEALTRVRRRLVDRLVSLFRPVRRYRCDNPACRFVGNLRARRRD